MDTFSAVLLHPHLLGHLGELQQQEAVVLSRVRRQRKRGRRLWRMEVVVGEMQKVEEADGQGEADFSGILVVQD